MAGTHEDSVRTAPQRLGGRHGRVDAERARDVVRRGDYTASARIAADDQRLPAQLRILQLLDRSKEGIQVEVRDDHSEQMYGCVRR